jgi:hypothetical protein
MKKSTGVVAAAATALLLAVAVAGVSTVSAQTYKMTTSIAPGVATPDTLETSIGTLQLNDGFPQTDTVEKIYDNLDRSRALQVYLRASRSLTRPACATRCASSGRTTRRM